MNLNTENRGERLYKAFIYVVLGILAVLILIPVLWVMVASVKETSEHYGSPWALPSHIHLQNFADAWTKANMGGYMLHSVTITVMALGIAHPYPLAEFCGCMDQGQHGRLYAPLRSDHSYGAGYPAGGGAACILLPGPLQVRW